MIIKKIQDFKNGWFIGNFEPTVLDTKDFEVCYKSFKEGEKFDPHFHKNSIEISLLTKGEMIMQNKKLVSGDIFIIQPYEVADSIFLTDCEIIAIKVPSSTDDKFYTKSIN